MGDGRGSNIAARGRHKHDALDQTADAAASVDGRLHRRSPRFVVRAVQFGFDKAEIRTVDVDWKFSCASVGLHNAGIQEARYSLTYPIGSIRPAERLRYPLC